MFKREKQNDLTWLMYRLDLFEQYCFPSVIRQTRIPTAWLIFIDVGTPAEARARLENLIAPHPFIKCLPCTEYTTELVSEYIRSNKSPDAQWMITTRLDTDDAINARLLESVYDAASIGTYEFLNAPSGLVVYKGRFYREEDTSNAFISASEPADNFKTVLIDQHLRLGKYAPVRQLPLKYAWLQIVHGDNIANRVRGLRVPSYSVKSEWDWIPEPLAAAMRKERVGETIADNSIGLLARTGASLVRWLRTKTERPNTSKT